MSVLQFAPKRGASLVLAVSPYAQGKHCSLKHFPHTVSLVFLVIQLMIRVKLTNDHARLSDMLSLEMLALFVITKKPLPGTVIILRAWE